MASGLEIEFDTSDFDTKLSIYEYFVKNNLIAATKDVANEVLRLSQSEVPHDVGTLQDSGHTEAGSDEYEVIVGYNTVYAAYLHEHPEFNFQKNRKGKYLEDPIKRNLPVFKKFFEAAMKG